MNFTWSSVLNNKASDLSCKLYLHAFSPPPRPFGHKDSEFRSDSDCLAVTLLLFIIADKARAKEKYINRGVGVVRD